jgi:hypothetical protein
MWSFPGLAVWSVLLVVMARARAQQAAVVASRQAAARQAAMLVSRQAAEEAAPLVVLAPFWPPPRANNRVSFLMMMRYRPMRTSLCRSGCSGFLTLEG